MLSDSEALKPFANKLRRLVDLPEAAEAGVQGLKFRLGNVGSSRYLVREGQESADCCVLLEGFACRHKLSGDGSRQIMSFLMKGDIVDFQQIFLPVADHNVQTITEAKVAWVPKTELNELTRQFPAISAALWKDCLIEASVFREWVLNVGRRDARARIAHMLCEFVTRCSEVGLGSPDQFHVPMTQEQIGDATGLTPVHVNRMLRALDEIGVIKRAGRDFRVSDWRLLQKIGDFRSEYLHSPIAA